MTIWVTTPVMVYDMNRPDVSVVLTGQLDIPIMALWISHRVLLMKELIGRRTSRGIPTDMKARRLSSACCSICPR